MCSYAIKFRGIMMKIVIWQEQTLGGSWTFLNDALVFVVFSLNHGDFAIFPASIWIHATCTKDSRWSLWPQNECSDMILKLVLREALHCDNPTYHWIGMNLQLNCSAGRDSLSLCKKYHPFISLSDSGSCSELPNCNSLSDFRRTSSEWCNLMVSPR